MSQYFLDRPVWPLYATEEQVRIIEAVLQTSSNLLINALAGAAKSTTLEFICKYKTGIPILSLAFNKRIADELSARLPSHVQCKTLNALGHRVWADAIGQRLTLDTKKTNSFVRTWIGENLKGRDLDDAWDNFGAIMKAVDSTKLSGYVPEGKYPSARPLRTELDMSVFEDEWDGNVPRWLERCIDWCINASIQSAYKGLIDFNDQIYMPTIFGGTFPAFPLVMVDEAQDLSPLNHQMLRRLVKQRLIAVGDPWQSIYGFRGAMRSGMAALKESFNMTELTLSVSFRCPRSVVRLANTRVPHMKFADWAPEGTVETLETWSPTSIPDGAAIICRNNAPLFKCALDLIAAGRGVKLLGADIGPSLIKTLKKLGEPSISQDELLNAIERWKVDRIAKVREVGAIEDKAECLRVFARAAPTLSGAIAFAEFLFAQGGTISLMSGHKSKGLEFETVYHLDPFRVPSKYATSEDAMDQELNLLYVIWTRAKLNLRMVTLDGLIP